MELKRKEVERDDVRHSFFVLENAIFNAYTMHSLLFLAITLLGNTRNKKYTPEREPEHTQNSTNLSHNEESMSAENLSRRLHQMDRENVCRYNIM